MGRQLERLRRPFPHHPLLLIATRSDERKSPGAKAPGFFVLAASGPRWIRRACPGIFGLRTRRRRLMIGEARPETCCKLRPVRADAFWRSCNLAESLWSARAAGP